MPKGTYDKEAIISYIYGSSSNTANAQHGAAHIIGARLAEKIKVNQDIMELFSG